MVASLLRLLISSWRARIISVTDRENSSIWQDLKSRQKPPSDISASAAVRQVKKFKTSIEKSVLVEGQAKVSRDNESYFQLSSCRGCKSRQYLLIGGEKIAIQQVEKFIEYIKNDALVKATDLFERLVVAIRDNESYNQLLNIRGRISMIEEEKRLGLVETEYRITRNKLRYSLIQLFQNVFAPQGLVHLISK